MSWIFFVIAGQFLNALVVVVDKHIVSSKVVSKPIIYAFYVSFLSIFVIFALPFGVTLPGSENASISLLAAIFYIFSIYFLYKSLEQSDPSDVIPVVGGAAAISAFISSSLILGENLPNHFLLAFFILVLGMVLISHLRFGKEVFSQIVASGFFFGLSTVLLKLLFLNDTFLNGFFWSRMANVLVALALLILPGVYRLLKDDTRSAGKNRAGRERRPEAKAAFIILNKTLAGMAFLLILIAIKFGVVSLVNALAATQYIFLLIFALIWQKKFPDYFSSIVHKHELSHKLAATTLIVIGFFVLFL